MKEPLHYIVVDDDPTNNLICRYIIKKNNEEASVKQFESPEEALTVIKMQYASRMNPCPIVLFLDINMPTMSGWEFLEEFMTFKEEIREQFFIYILSSSIEDFSEKQEEFPIVQGFLSKPLNLSGLERVAEEYLESGCCLKK